MGKEEYTPRVIDSFLAQLLSFNGAVLIEGPRACGKTMTALNASASSVFLDSEQAGQLATVSPSLLLEGESPRLVDEWQVIPEVWNLVRRVIDAKRVDGQFILTGSSVPSDDITRHTGAGRIYRLRQRTMTWSERGKSTNTVSLSGLFEGELFPASTESTPIETIIENLCVSGFPAHIHRTSQQTLMLMNAYAHELAHSDVQTLETIRHEPEVLLTLLRAVARSNASEVTLKTLAQDIQTVAPNIKVDTVSKYLQLFERVFAVEKIPAWSGKLRSKATLRTSPKYILADPALAVALLNATPTSLINDLETTSFLFEAAVLHDLAVYAESLGGRVHHFRDSNGNEIDAIITLPDGRWGAIEIKLGGRAAVPAAEKLPRLTAILDPGRPASFSAVITGTGMTLPFDNGVVTFPLSVLTA